MGLVVCATDQRRDRHHYDDPEFGFRFITAELAEAGITAGRKWVNRLCTIQRLWSVRPHRRCWPVHVR
jgi:hypothetical protein